MSEAEKDTSSAKMETWDSNMNPSGSEIHATEQNNAKNVTVKTRNFALESAVPAWENGSAGSSGTKSPQSPRSTTSSGQYTYGYVTNEAIPMTAFYRSHSGRQRPTLEELCQGFKNDQV